MDGKLWKVRLPCAVLLQFFFCITWRQPDFPIPRRHSHCIPLFLSRVEVLCETPPTLYRCTMQYVKPARPSLDLVTSSPAPAVYPEHSSPCSERHAPSASATWDGRSSTTSVPLPQRQVVVRRLVRGVIPCRTAITGHPDQNHRTGTGFRNLSKLADGQLLHRKPRCSNHVSPHTRLSQSRWMCAVTGTTDLDLLLPAHRMKAAAI